MNHSPKIAVISNCTPRDAICLAPLFSRFPDIQLVRPDYSNIVKSKQTFADRIFSLYTSKRQGLIQRMIKRRAFDLVDKFQPKNEERLYQQDIIGEAGAEYFKSLNPDILITCNAPLLPESIFSIPTLGTYNLHYGIAPFYRGNHTLFFALKNKDSDKVGACLHRISKGIDTGNLMFCAYPEVKPRDTEIHFHIALAKAASKLLLEFVESLPESAKAPGKTQSEKGRLYTNKARGFWEDLQCPFFLPVGLDRGYKEERFF